MISPNSRIILLKTPMELNDKNQLTFANATAQYNYFYNLPKVELDNATFQRKDGVIRFETDSTFTYDDVLLFNYCMYQNESYGNKWFYAYITDVTYKSDGMSELKIKTDVFQTWQFDVTWKQSFVEREHLSVANDIAGANLVPENLETGEYVFNSIVTNTDLQDLCPVISSNYDAIIDTDQGYYNGNVYQAYGLYILRTTLQTEWDEQAQIQAIAAYMYYIAGKGKSDSVLSLFMAPRKLAGWDLTKTWTTLGNIGHTFGIINAGYDYDYTQPYSFTAMTINKPTTLNGYTPKNKKLLTYPYCYLNLNNNSGQICNFYYEDFSQNTITFNIKGVLSVSCSIRAIPQKYKGVEDNYAYGLNLGKYPTCSWNNDIYVNWLTQNAVNIPLDIASGAISTGAGIATGNVTGALGGAISIGNTLSSIYSHSLNPVQTAGNINSGDINAGAGKNTFTLEAMSIKSQFAQIIDNYFSMFGYKTNLVKMPNFSTRSNWNYIKTIDCNVIGDLPQTDLEEYRKLFDDGITLWHNASTFLDYSQNNN